MNDVIEILHDGDGIALFGDSTAIEQFLGDSNLASRELDLRRFAGAAGTASVAAKVASEVAANSGRWVKLSEASAKALKGANTMKGSAPGLSRAIITGKGGRTKTILEFVRTPGAVVTNPALLAGVGGIMAQIAMQQQMDEISDYLRVIDQKCDDILRAQENAVYADMIGVGLLIDEAIAIRDQVGRVSEVTWSKVQGSPQTILRTQAYALKQIETLTKKLKDERSIGALAMSSAEVEGKVQEWLVVLARCVQLQDALAVLELDRVFDSTPADLDSHRTGLKSVKEFRLAAISNAVHQMLDQSEASAQFGAENMLLHPVASRKVQRSSQRAADSVVNFQTHLGLESDGHSIRGRSWINAVEDTRDVALVTIENGQRNAKKFGATAVEGVNRKAEGLIAKMKRKPAEPDDF